MTQNSEVNVFHVTRWRQLIFPQHLIIDHNRVLTRKRGFPAFWIVKEESIPLRSVASIQVSRGLLFSRIMVENSGGPFPIIVNGIPNKHTIKIRELIENYQPVTRQAQNPVIHEKETTEKQGGASREKGRPLFNPFAKKKNNVIVESMEDTVAGQQFDPILNTGSTEERAGTSIVDGNELPTIDQAVYESDEKDSASPGWMEDLVSRPAGDQSVRLTPDRV